MRILLFDIYITGHHSEYIGHLINYIVNGKSSDDYFFVVHPLFLKKFTGIVDKSVQSENIFWIPITEKELLKSEKTGIVQKSIRMYRIMNKYAVHYKVDHVVLLTFNTFQLALGLFKPSYTISGILFKPFFRMAKKGNYIRYYRKYFQTLLFTLNNRINKIFILNDQHTVESLNNEFNTGIFKMLPDPLPELTPLKGFDIYKEYNIIDNERKIFLHLGSLSERKGTFDILDSITLLSSEIKSKVFVLLVGRAEKGVEAKIVERLQILNMENVVLWDSTFVSNRKMKSLFEQCFAVLIPYKNQEASSGILGHAGVSFKPVIGPSAGLLGKLIEIHNLGFGLEDCTPKNISKAIISSVYQKFTIDNRNINFIKSHQPEEFSRQLLEK